MMIQRQRRRKVNGVGGLGKIMLSYLTLPKFLRDVMERSTGTIRSSAIGCEFMQCRTSKLMASLTACSYLST